MSIARLVAALLAAGALLAPSALRAQGSAYRAIPDTAFVQVVNDHHMYLLRGGDTVGAPVRRVALERQSWAATPGGDLTVVVRQTALGVRRESTADTFVVTPAGRVRTINGDPTAPRGRYDFLPALPPQSVALTEGAAWSDTLAHARPAEMGDYVQRLERRYRVVRAWNDGGRRAVRVEGTGTARYRDVHAVTNAPGRHWWIDVSGPVRESFTFYPDEGRLADREWTMELSGRAGVPGAHEGIDTVPAGLRSAWRSTPAAPEVARLMTRDLPGADTSITSAGRPVYLHTVARRGGAIESGMAGADGAVATARSEWRDAGPTTGVVPDVYTAVWTDGAAEERCRVERKGRALHVDGARDTVVQLPARDELWAVADAGMEEHLVPAVMRVPVGAGGVTLSVFRPREGRWDEYLVSAAPLPAARLVTLTPREAGPGALPVQLVVTDEGDLLAARNAAGEGDRLPVPGTRRAEKMEDLVAMVKGADGEVAVSSQR